jgi:hypothetical protein
VQLGHKVASDFFLPGIIKGAVATCAATFIDTASQFVFGFPQRHKDELIANTLVVLQEFRSAGHPVSVLQSDSEVIFKSAAMKALLDKQGVRGQYAAPDRHEQVGAGERIHRLIKERIITLFVAAPHVPLSLWHYAYVKVVQCLNRTPRALAGKTPFELFYGIKPSMDDVGLPFGQPLHIFIPKERRSEVLSAKSVEAAYLGITRGSKDCIDCYNFNTKRVVSTRDFVLVSKIARAPTLMEIPSSQAGQPAIPVVGQDELESTVVSVPPLPETVPVIDARIPINIPSAPTLTEAPSIQAGQPAAPVVSQLGAESTIVLPSPPPVTKPLTDAMTPSILAEDTARAVGYSEPSGTPAIPVENPVTLAAAEPAQGLSTSVSTSGASGDLVETSTVTQQNVVGTNTPQINGAGGEERGSMAVSPAPAPRYCTRSQVHKIRGTLTTILPLIINNVFCVRLSVWNICPGVSIREARASTRWPQWKTAMEAEMQQLLDRQVFKVVERLPKGTKPLRTHFVLDEKVDATGKFEKLKARLVVDGNRQSVLTFDLVASPTARTTSIKLLAALAAKLGLQLQAYDVAGAYLHVPIQETKSMANAPEIYITLPDGKYAKLNRFLYGMKQSGLEWYFHHRTCLESLGYVVSAAEPCMFIWRSSNDHGSPIADGEDFHIVVTWVDDDLGMASNSAVEDRYYKHMRKRYGEVKRKTGSFTFVGVFIEHLDTGAIRFSQPNYYRTLSEAAELPMKGRPISTPTSFMIPDLDDDNSAADRTEYLRILGSLSYLVGMTRCDGAYLVSVASTKAVNPTKRDLRILKRGVRYFLGTPDYGITFSPDGPISLVCFVDASYACHDDAKSQTGYSFCLGPTDPVFYARSAKQKITALSSTEAEYIALCEATREVVHLRQLLTDIGFPQEHPTPVFKDNSACIQFTQGFRNHRNTKHISVRYHFSKDKVEDGTISMVKISTEDQRADYLTKAVNAELLERSRALDLNTNPAREGVGLSKRIRTK